MSTYQHRPAYDYTTQQWVNEPVAAKDLHLKQQLERLALLKSPQGPAFAQMTGIDLHDATESARLAVEELQA